MKTPVTLEVDGLAISGQLYPPGKGARALFPAVCVCHGIPSGVTEPGDKGYAPLAERFSDEGFAVLIFNFRGTGASAGNFDILGWARDLKAAIDYLWALPDLDKSRLSLLGFSAGAAVSIYAASQDKRVSSVAACASPAEFNLITEADDPRSVISHFRHVGIIKDKDFPGSVEDWLGGFRVVSPVQNVAMIAPRRLLIVHSREDEVVPVSHAHRLYDSAGESRQLVIIDGAEHRLRQNVKAMTAVIDWLKSHPRID